MKQFILYTLLLLLLGAEQGWADEIIDMNVLCTVAQSAPNRLEYGDCPDILPKCATLEKPRLQIECDGPYPSALCDQRRDPCLAKMEQAMRAMDEYRPIDVIKAGVLLGKTGLGTNGEQWLREYAAKATKVEQLWDAAKRECWRQP